MFEKVRRSEENYKKSQEREEQEKSRAYDKANLYQRNMFDAFEGLRIKIDEKSAYFECKFTGNDVSIEALGFYSEFKFFESQSTHERRVREFVRNKTRNLGYSGCPVINFKYC